jgi:hypothetical protein
MLTGSLERRRTYDRKRGVTAWRDKRLIILGEIMSEEEKKQAILLMRQCAEELEKFFSLIECNEMVIAKMNLEQAVMWAAKAWLKVA